MADISLAPYASLGFRTFLIGRLESPWARTTANQKQRYVKSML